MEAAKHEGRVENPDRSIEIAHVRPDPRKSHVAAALSRGAKARQQAAVSHAPAFPMRALPDGDDRVVDRRCVVRQSPVHFGVVCVENSQ